MSEPKRTKINISISTWQLWLGLLLYFVITLLSTGILRIILICGLSFVFLILLTVYLYVLYESNRSNKVRNRFRNMKCPKCDKLFFTNNDFSNLKEYSEELNKYIQSILKLLRVESKEFKILKALMERPNTVLDRQNILDLVWGPDVHLTDRTIDTHLAAVRKKLGKAGEMIRSIRGVGYEFGLA